MTYRLYNIEEIPRWCHLPPPEHFDGIGGCWGITYQDVAKKGRRHCAKCEYYGEEFEGDDARLLAEWDRVAPPLQS